MIYQGEMQFSGVLFDFAFDEKQLSLIPKQGEEEKAKLLVWDKVGEGAYAFGNKSAKISEEFFVLKPNNSQGILVLFPLQDAIIPDNPFGFCVGYHCGIKQYYSLFSGNEGIEALRFTSPYLDLCFGGLTAGDTYSFSDEEIALQIKKTEPYRFSFNYGEKAIEGELSRSVSVGFSQRTNPVRISAQLLLKFEHTSDYSFIFDLIKLARDFIAFYSRIADVVFYKIDLLHFREFSDTNGEGTKRVLCEMGEAVFECDSNVSPDIGILKGYIPMGKYDSLEASVFEALIDGKLPLRNLPVLSERNAIDEARIIFLATAFDYASSNLLLDDSGNSSDETSRDAIRAILLPASKDMCQTSGTRRLAKRLIDRLEKPEVSFEARMNRFKKQHPILVETIDSQQHLEGRKYSEMTKRIADLRNALAHGRVTNILKNEHLFEDFFFLEKITLAAQLLYLGLDEQCVIDVLKRTFNH